jgi:hypothetical protein
MPDLQCPERTQLSEAVVKAVQDVYAAHSAYHLAIAEKRYTALTAVSLQDARTAERLAVAALDKHRKEHGC